MMSSIVLSFIRNKLDRPITNQEAESRHPTIFSLTFSFSKILWPLSLLWAFLKIYIFAVSCHRVMNQDNSLAIIWDDLLRLEIFSIGRTANECSDHF